MRNKLFYAYLPLVVLYLNSVPDLVTVKRRPQ